ncbi:MAG: alanine racemase, partial [Saprospiraceae bacterium]
RIHLKLDTGMKRLGIEKKQIGDLKKFMQGKNISVLSVFSHLSASDEKDHDDFTSFQFEQFRLMLERLEGSFSIPPLRHILNSAGIVRFPDQQMDMVRLGIGLYGIDTSDGLLPELQAISTLKARISQIKYIRSRQSVGYNRAYRARKNYTRIATVSIGYADGLARSTGNEKYSLLIRGKQAKIIGVICMDMCMVDITKIPNARVGDEVIIFGENPTIQELADVMGTIPYEVLTAISDRVKRVYLMD